MSAKSTKFPPRSTRGKFATILESHLEVLRNSVSRLIATPLSSLMTMFVISIALLLPALLQIVGNNLSLVNEQFAQSARITLYLDDNVTPESGLELTRTLLDNPEITETRYISKGQALAEFASNSGFGSTVMTLGENPLPASIIVAPAQSTLSSAESLYEELAHLPGVEFAQIDLEWIQRLDAFRAVIERVGLIFSLVLGLAVVFIVGNTIRLGIEGRKNEIKVIQLVGGSNSFVARPFLYTGALLGIGGAVLSCLLIVLIQTGFNRIFDNLLALYGAEFELQGYSLLESLSLLLLGGCLGWGGALISTRQQLIDTDE